MEPEKDYVIIRDGDTPLDEESPVLVKLTGAREDNPQFVMSTGNSLYIYTRTDQADSRKGYRIKYYTGNFGVWMTTVQWRLPQCVLKRAGVLANNHLSPHCLFGLVPRVMISCLYVCLTQVVTPSSSSEVAPYSHPRLV